MPIETATTTRFELPSKLTLPSVRTPLAATVANRTSPAPPRTGSGRAATAAPGFRTRPSTTRIMPPTETAKRLLVPVTATRPTFCAKALAETHLAELRERAVDAVPLKDAGAHGLLDLAAGAVVNDDGIYPG